MTTIKSEEKRAASKSFQTATNAASPSAVPTISKILMGLNSCQTSESLQDYLINMKNSLNTRLDSAVDREIIKSGINNLAQEFDLELEAAVGAGV